MHLTAVKKANEFIKEHLQEINPLYRHHFHLMGEVGWINDPNGFIYYQGEYHLFFQYYPYDSVWGPMHWGHAKSKDLTRWEALPVALAPSEEYDRGGCFSGSAIEKDGKLYLMYTGHVEEGDFRREVQCLALSTDGVTFEKYAGNPVISEPHIANVAKIEEFRDPKVFKKEETYYCVVAAETFDKRGQILLFKSADLFDWSFVSVLLEGTKKQGVMWECPDLFHLDGKDVLIMSPIAYEREEHAYWNLNSTIAFIGEVNWETGKFAVENAHEIDYGLDFYAPQTCLGPNEERIMVAWMQMWKRKMPTHERNHGWAGAMTLPRELHVVDNCLVQSIPETFLKQLELQTVVENHSLDKEDYQANLVNTQQYLKIQLTLPEEGVVQINYAKSAKGYLALYYDAKKEQLTLSREQMGEALPGDELEILTKRTVPVQLKQNEFTLELIRDTTSIELITQDGQTMTMTFYEEKPGEGSLFEITGNAIINKIEVSEIK